MRKTLDGVWHLEDDSPQAVRCVEMSPRAAYTKDDLEAILTRIHLAVALAWMEKYGFNVTHIDSFTWIWKALLDNETPHVYQELVHSVE